MDDQDDELQRSLLRMMEAAAQEYPIRRAPVPIRCCKGPGFAAFLWRIDGGIRVTMKPELPGFDCPAEIRLRRIMHDATAPCQIGGGLPSGGLSEAQQDVVLQAIYQAVTAALAGGWLELTGYDPADADKTTLPSWLGVGWAPVAPVDRGEVAGERCPTVKVFRRHLDGLSK